MFLLEKIVKKIQILIHRLESFSANKGPLFRIPLSIALLFFYILDVSIIAALVAFGSPQKSFEHMNKLTKKGYTRSYHEHSRWHRTSQKTALISIFAVVVVNISVGLFTNSAAVFAAGCSISSNTAVDQAYIDTNSCDNINVTANAVLTFTGPIDLGGAGDYVFTINNTVSAVFSGDFTLSDPGDSLVVSGQIKQVPGDTNGIKITAQNVTISSTGAIDAFAAGCPGGVPSSQDGFGPDIADFNTNGNTKECLQSQAGYGKTARGGAAHSGTGGRQSTTDSSQKNTYGIVHAPGLLGSGGAGGPNGDDSTGEIGGKGGGLIRLDVPGTLTVDGPITANGGNGAVASNGAGGGSGGSIYITAGTLTGTQNITANGGNGNVAGGGGGGGRVAVYYNTLSTFNLGNIQANKGFKGASANTTDGSAGSTFILNRRVDDGVGNLNVTSGLDFQSGVDWTRDNVTFANGSDLRCRSFTTLDLGATNTISFQGANFNCGGVDFINLSAATLSMSNNNTMMASKPGAQIDWNITNDITLTNFNFSSGGAGTASASGGVLTLDNPINVSLVNSTINSSINWTGVGNVTIDGTSSINASGKGCAGGNPASQNGFGPNPSICQQAAGGYGKASRGGGAHAGAGGRGFTAGTEQTFTYGSNTIPVLFGSGGGGGSNAGENAGSGGGIVRLDSIGTLTINGSIQANGFQAPASAGGASGGSVYITTQTLAGSGNVTVNGGNGNTNGGGGGGGRAAVYYSALSGFNTNNITAFAGLKGGGTGTADGGAGTVYTIQFTAPANPSPNAPSNGATGQNRNVSLTSSAYSSNGATHTTSDWQISDDNTFSEDCSDINLVWCKLDSSNKESVVVNSANGSFQNALAGKISLAPNTVYYFRVRHTNAVGDSNWSPVNSFTTAVNTPPNQPSASSPADAETGVVLNPNLSSSAYSDTDGDPHVGSSWAVFESSDCTGTPVWNKSNDATNLTSIGVNTTNGTFAGSHSGQSQLKSHTTFSYYVKYKDPFSNSLDSACAAFSTLNNSPILGGSVADLNLTEDTDVLAAFDVDDNLSDPDWNDTSFTCGVTDDLDAGLGTLTLNGDNTVDVNLVADANGSDTIQLSCDDAGSASVSTNVVTVTVASVNDAPSFVKGANQAVSEDAGEKSVTGWATSLNRGASNESSQVLSFTVSNDNNILFSSQPAIASNGNLTYTPAANANGSATVTVSIADNGGVANGGTDTSASQTFTITVNPVNDKPVANAGANKEINEDTATTTLDGSGSSDIDGDTLTFGWVETLDNGDLCSISSASSATPTISVANGVSSYSCVYQLTVSDGIIDSDADSVNVSVTADNDEPELVVTSSNTVAIDEGDRLVIPIVSSDVDTDVVDLGAGVVAGEISDIDQLFTDNGDNTGLFDWETTTEDSGDYTVRFSASDGASEINRDIDITVASAGSSEPPIDEGPTNNAPTFSGSLPNVAVLSGAITGKLFNLNNYFKDADNDKLTYKMTRATGVKVNIKSGRVRLSAANGGKNTAAVTFTATDPYGATVSSNEVVIEVSAAKIKNVSHVDGGNNGKGKIQVVNDDGKVVSAWRAFPKGGSIPRLGTIKDKGYIFVVKKKSGSTLQVYTLNGDIVAKKKLSPNLHWRTLATGNLSGDSSTEEIAVSTHRGSTIYLRVFSFDPVQGKFTLRKRTAYAPLKSNKYSIHIQKDKVYVYKPNGKKAFSWKPF